MRIRRLNIFGLDISSSSDRDLEVVRVMVVPLGEWAVLESGERLVVLEHA